MKKREKEEKISDKKVAEINNNKRNLVNIWKKISYENKITPICEKFKN